jgi:hypothetical protein
MLCADDLAVLCLTIYGSENADHVIKYCRHWSLKYNLNMIKVPTFNEGGRLKKKERWAVCSQKTEATN